MAAIEKIASEIQSIEWKIKRVQKDIERAKESLVSSTSQLDSNLHNIVFVQQYAQEIADKYSELQQLEETKRMLEYLTK